MPIKRLHRINPARAIPVLGYISKGLKLGNAPLDTNRFWVSFNPKLFSPAEIARMEKQWAEFHGLSAMPDSNGSSNGFLTLWKTMGGADKAKDGKVITEASAKRAILSSGVFPNGTEHNYAAKRLDGLTLITDDANDDISYESWLEWRVRNKQNDLKLLIRCDMETQHLRMNKDTWRLERSDVPCQRESKTSCQCKPSITLRVVYWDFMKRYRIPYGYFVIQSGAWNDDSNILPSLGYIQQNYAEAYDIPMSKIPFSVWREPFTYTYVDNGNNKTKTDHVIKLAATSDFILSLGTMPASRRAVKQDETGKAIDLLEEEPEVGWEHLGDIADSEDIPADEGFDPFEFDGFEEDYDGTFEGGGSEDIPEQGMTIDQWWALAFGETIEGSLAYWKQAYPHNEYSFPDEDTVRKEPNGMFVLARALAAARIRIPIDRIYRTGNKTHGFLGVEDTLLYHIRTVEDFKKAGLADEHVELLRQEGVHHFDITALDYPTGILVMKTRKSGSAAGTVYFDMTEIELSEGY